MTHKLPYLLSIVSLFVALTSSAQSVPPPLKNVDVLVDCSRAVGGPLHLWGYVNVSRRAPPPVELGEVIEREFGRPKVTRCWLMLDQMWDYRTDEYRFNYEINRDYYVGDPNKKRYGVAGETTGLHYYDYIDSVSRHSDAVMLNIRRYEQEVLCGMISLDKWKTVFKSAVAHYKTRCPNLRYIEVLNEPTAKNQSNLNSIQQYYRFYRCAYQAINELNAELHPDVPLQVGGSSGFRTKEAIHLVHDFAKDPDPEKRLDFLSFHHYWANDRPAQVAGWEEEIDAALARDSLPTNIPIFVTEIGYTLKWRNDASKNLWQAAGMTAYQYFARKSPDLRLLPWVQYHSPAQIALVQFDTKLEMTPYGASVKMLRMHQPQEVRSETTGLQGNGDGVGCLATLGDGKLVVQLWNLDPKLGDPILARVRILSDSEPSNPERESQVKSLKSHAGPFTGKRVCVRKYLIDSHHSNCFAAEGPAAALELAETSEMAVAKPFEFSVTLEPMGLCLWEIETVAP